MKPGKKAYPAWRYHRTLKPCIVKTPAEDAALGQEWKHSPAEFAAPPAPPAPSPPTTLAEQFYDQRVDDLLPIIAEIDNIETLYELKAIEVEHKQYPGGRRRVVRALDERIVVLTATTEA